MIILFSCLPTKLGNEDCSYMSIYMMLKSEHRKLTFRLGLAWVW